MLGLRYRAWPGWRHQCSVWPWANHLTSLGFQDTWPRCSLRAVLLLPGDSSPYIIKTRQFLKPWQSPKWELFSLEPQMAKDQDPWSLCFGILDISQIISKPHSTFECQAPVWGQWGWPEVKLWTGQGFLGTFSATLAVGTGAVLYTTLTACLGLHIIPLSSLSPCSKPMR